MILTGAQIRRAQQTGDIIIEPFDERQVGPNAYDFRLGTRCRTYTARVLDTGRPNRSVLKDIPSKGLLLHPNRIYLVNTEEKMGSTRYVPIIRGRSSVGRLGLFIDITADLIDLGSINQWTLQLHCVQPVRVYPGMLIGQVTFWRTFGRRTLYNGKYQDIESPVASLSYQDRGLDQRHLLGHDW
jgi:dCTP deaminase